MPSSGPHEEDGSSDLPVIGELQVRSAEKRIAQLRFVEREEEFRLDLVLVVASRRGQGIGTALIRRLTDLADAAGKPVSTTARPIGTNSSTALERLVAYYLRLGFSIVERGVSSVQMRRPPRSRFQQPA